ncbi:MAG TPA: GNAT family N-acetyltransferase [Longimicrobiales bacterium]
MIETDRLLLREFRPSDGAFALALLNEPAFLQFIGDRGVRTIDDAARWIETGPRANYARLGFGHYVVTLKQTDEPIGICGLRTREGLNDPDLGYALLQKHWGHGYALEAARAVLQWCRTALKIPRVLAICSPANGPSIAMLEKLDFTYQQRMRLPNENHDVLLYAYHFDDGGGADPHSGRVQSELSAERSAG